MENSYRMNLNQHVLTVGKHSFAGLFPGRYVIRVAPYDGVDFSRLCLIFSGQGSAFPGMFAHEYRTLTEIRQRIDEADELASRISLPPISSYLTNTSTVTGQELVKLRNLSLFSIQVALTDYLNSHNIQPTMVTGFSMGEMAALVAAGIVSFPDMFMILHYRDHCAPPANELGFMIAVSAEKDAITEALIGTAYNFSNFCSPSQTVISTSHKDLLSIRKQLKAAKLPAKLLKEVPQPYHSPLLATVSRQVQAYIEEQKFNFQLPVIPLYSSVTDELITAHNFSGEYVAGLIARQLITPVDFISQIKAIYHHRCHAFMEVGPGDTFVGFAHEILHGEDHKIRSLNECFPVLKTNPIVAELDLSTNKFFAILRDIIGRVTGYKIEKITIEDKFQEDLGIDSIKKADILISVMKESTIGHLPFSNLAGVKSLRDAVTMLSDAEQHAPANPMVTLPNTTAFYRYVKTWRSTPFPAPYKSSSSSYHSLILNLNEIMTGKYDLVKEVNDHITHCPNNYRVLIILQSIDPDIALSPGSFAQSLSHLMNVIVTFRNLTPILKNVEIDLALITLETGHPIHRGLSAFFMAMRKELSKFYFKSISISTAHTSDICRQIAEREFQDPFSVETRHDQFQRFVAVWQLAPLAFEGTGITDGKTIVAFGGASGITYSLLLNLCRLEQPIIHLVGRRAESDPVVATNLMSLRHLNPEIHYHSCDAGDHVQVAELLKQIRDRHGHIDTIINGTGVEVSRKLIDREDREIEAELRGKLGPVWAILDAVEMVAPRLFINFSSVVAQCGNAGQTVYSYANALSDYLLEEFNRRQDRTRAIAIDWPPWDGVGMTANLGIKESLRQFGLSLLSESRACELFHHELSGGTNGIISYANPADGMKYTLPLKGYHRLKPLLGELQAEMFFVKHYVLTSDRYLLDHQIDGICYVPAAVGIGTFIALAALHDSSYNHLRNFQIHNPIMVKSDPVNCRLEAQVMNRGNDPSEVPAITMTLNSPIPHFSADAFMTREFEATIPMISLLSNKPTEMGTIYGPNGFFHGPTFQTIHECRIGINGLLAASVDNDKLLPIHSLYYFDRLIQWLDTAFQILALNALQNHGVMAIPVSVDEIQWHWDYSIADRISVIPTSMTKVDSAVTGDVIVVNATAQPLLRLQGIILAVIKKTDSMSRL